MSKSWLEKNYPVGAKISVPHLKDDKTEQVTVINHTIDSIGFPFPKGPTGIMVQFGDAMYMEIERGYLNENGGGIV